MRISIHAPTRGATLLCKKSNYRRQISIHAPTRGATLLCKKSNYRRQISIHAPTRGATFSIHRYKPIVVFQSTLPRGERLFTCKFVQYSSNFNPRSHEGSDCNGSLAIRQRAKFQSTLPRGERRSAKRVLRKRRSISIHAPTRGATSPNS